jgi:hypothetical protein
MGPEEMGAPLVASALEGAALVYFDGRLTEAALLLARAARAAGVPVLVEGERLRPGLDALLAEADYVVTSAHFPQVRWPLGLVGCLGRLPPGLPRTCAKRSMALQTEASHPAAASDLRPTHPMCCCTPLQRACSWLHMRQRRWVYGSKRQSPTAPHRNPPFLPRSGQASRVWRTRSWRPLAACRAPRSSSQRAAQRAACCCGARRPGSRCAAALCPAAGFRPLLLPPLCVDPLTSSLAL